MRFCLKDHFLLLRKSPRFNIELQSSWIILCKTGAALFLQRASLCVVLVIALTVGKDLSDICAYQRKKRHFSVDENIVFCLEMSQKLFMLLFVGIALILYLSTKTAQLNATRLEVLYATLL